MDVAENFLIIAAERDFSHQSAFSVAVRSQSTHDAEIPFSVEEAAEPITEGIGNGEPNGYTFSLNSPRKGVMEVDSVDEAVPLGNAFVAYAQSLRDFRVTEASRQHITLFLMVGGVEEAIQPVCHFFVSNGFISLVRRPSYYDKA